MYVLILSKGRESHTVRDSTAAYTTTRRIQFLKWPIKSKFCRAICEICWFHAKQSFLFSVQNISVCVNLVLFTRTGETTTLGPDISYASAEPVLVRTIKKRTSFLSMPLLNTFVSHICTCTSKGGNHRLRIFVFVGNSMTFNLSTRTCLTWF